MKRGSIWGIIIVIFCLAAIMPAAGAYASNSSSTASTSATAYHINAQHNGLQTDTLTPPLSHKWTKTLGGSAFYPLIAESKVFDTAITSQGEGLLYAFDISTGKTVWGPIDLGSAGFFSKERFSVVGNTDYQSVLFLIAAYSFKWPGLHRSCRFRRDGLCLSGE